MAFIFTMRSTTAGSMHTHDKSVSSSLPAISEDDASLVTPSRIAPPVPPRAWNRPEHKKFGLGAELSFNHEGSPPEYNEFDYATIEGPNGEKLTELRRGLANTKQIAKRGGWKRLTLIALLLLLIIVALVVGLVVGLKKKKSSS